MIRRSFVIFLLVLLIVAFASISYAAKTSVKKDNFFEQVHPSIKIKQSIEPETWKILADPTQIHQLATEILKVKPDMPIIICTGFSERISLEKAKSIGVKALMMKPIIKSRMAVTVREVLDGVI